jgi:hypothetical protein
MGIATGQVQFEMLFIPGSTTCQAGSAESISPAATDVGTDWTTVATRASTVDASSVLFEIYVRKTDQSAEPLDVEIDMAYLAPTPGTGWQ